jgi:hypothetical protein
VGDHLLERLGASAEARAANDAGRREKVTA